MYLLSSSRYFFIYLIQTLDIRYNINLVMIIIIHLRIETGNRTTVHTN